MSKHVQCALAALGACVLGGIVVAIVTVAEWLAPTTPALALLATAFLPAILAGLMMAAPADNQSWTRQLVLVGLLPGLIFGLLTVGLGGLWTQPGVRAAAAAMLTPGFQNAKPLLRGLDDPSPAVAIEACIKLATPNFGSRRLDALERLTHRPDVALSCLQHPGATTGPDEMLSLARAWHLRLHEAFDDEQAACKLSEALGAMEVDRPGQAARLLRCALQADDPYASGCCAATLSARYSTPVALASQLQGTEQTMAVLGLGTSLLQASFLDRQRIGAMSLKTSEFQRLSLLSGCATLSSHPGQVLSTFYQLSDSLSCPSAGKESPTSVESWTSICQTVTRRIVTQPDLVPQDLFCSAIVEDEERQVVQARERERARVRNPDLGRLSMSIVVGDDRVRADARKASAREREDFYRLAEQRREPGQDEEQREFQRQWNTMMNEIATYPDGSPRDKDRQIEEDETFEENIPDLLEQSRIGGASRRQLKEAEERLRFLTEEGFIREP
jgi:hypothetical protein